MEKAGKDSGLFEDYFKHSYYYCHNACCYISGTTRLLYGRLYRRWVKDQKRRSLLAAAEKANIVHILLFEHDDRCLRHLRSRPGGAGSGVSGTDDDDIRRIAVLDLLLRNGGAARCASFFSLPWFSLLVSLVFIVTETEKCPWPSLTFLSAY